MRIVIYARTERDDQYADAALQSQIERCKQATAQYGGISAVYTDKAPGLARENRPGLLRLIQDRPDLVVVTSISRIARDMRQMNAVFRMLRESGSVIYALNEDICFPAAPIQPLM